MWGWLKPVLEFFAALFRAEAEKPRTIEDANTPEDIRARWDASLRDKLRDKNGSDRPPE